MSVRAYISRLSPPLNHCRDTSIHRYTHTRTHRTLTLRIHMLAHLHAYIHKHLKIVELPLSLANSIVSFSLLLALSLAPYRFPSLFLSLSLSHTHINRIQNDFTPLPKQLSSLKRKRKVLATAKAKSSRVNEVSMRCGAVWMG